MSEDEAAARARIDAILAGLPDGQRSALQDLRTTIASAVPDAVEAISYGAPAFRYRGRPLATYSAAKAHVSYFPMSPDVLDGFRAELAGFDLSKGTIRFTPAHPIPAELVTRIVRTRMAEIDAKVG